MSFSGTTEATARGTRFRIDGSGEPLVLIHGVGMDLAMWEPMVAHLGSRRRVIRYDMQGHGESAKPHGPYALADFVAQLGRLVDDLAIEATDLVGFSMGALVAQGFALADPGRVRRLVLLNGVFDRSPAERAAIEARVGEVLQGGYAASIEAAIDRWFTPGFRAKRPEVVKAVRRRMQANDLPSYAAAYAVFGTADRELVDRVQRLTMPVLVATGAEDQRSTAAMAEALAARLPQGRCHLIAGQRHLTPLEVPEELAMLIDEFLAAGHPAVAAAAR